ncbi:hypothetical protein Cgig2_027413 [Carnegiea gigantea]|uniref:Uncharacterized protein n=1 Tax=Carnegiea gigantea TaxID=171969 RepID=A0A9Q1JUD0_9CARY|nr:hypothetical protein Cgig2_027413 [Carnegiea gigantea]
MENETPLLRSKEEEEEEDGQQHVGLTKEFYSLGALTQTFAGFVGDLELAAVSVENSVIANLAFGVMLGMSSALETLCGQAFGAGNLSMLGVYMQRSWIILLFTSLLLTPLYIYSPPILRLFGETEEISQAAGEFALWMIPQLFAYAFNFPIQKFLQAQRKVLVMAWMSALVLVMHAALSWLFMLKWGWGLVGAAVMLNTSWWLIVSLQCIYILITKSDGAWSGFSWLAFYDLWGFVKLSLASGLGNLVLDGSGRDHRSSSQPFDICRCYLYLHEPRRMGYNDCIWFQCCYQCTSIKRTRSWQLSTSQDLCACSFRDFGGYRICHLHSSACNQRLVSLPFHCKRRCGSRNNKAFGHVGMHSPTQQPSASSVRQVICNSELSHES